jgi:hypothetical protein
MTPCHHHALLAHFLLCSLHVALHPSPDGFMHAFLSPLFNTPHFNHSIQALSITTISPFHNSSLINMASKASAQPPLPILLLVFFASVAFSTQSGNPCDCPSSCSAFEGEAKEQCMRICTQICSTEEPGIKDQDRRRGEREERHNPYHFGKERYSNMSIYVIYLL